MQGLKKGGANQQRKKKKFLHCVTLLPNLRYNFFFCHTLERKQKGTYTTASHSAFYGTITFCFTHKKK